MARGGAQGRSQGWHPLLAVRSVKTQTGRPSQDLQRSPESGRRRRSRRRVPQLRGWLSTTELGQPPVTSPAAGRGGVPIRKLKGQGPRAGRDHSGSRRGGLRASPGNVEKCKSRPPDLPNVKRKVGPSVSRKAPQSPPSSTSALP